MKPIAEYTLLERQQTVRLRGADNQQNNTGILYRPPTAQTATGAREGALTGAPGGGVGESLVMGIGLGGFELFNSSGGAIILAIGVRIPNPLWRAGLWTDAATTPFTDDTADAQSTTAADFALESTTASDGLVIHSRVPFNCVSFDVGTAADGGVPVRAARYSNAAGGGWTALSTLLLSDNFESTGERIWLWRTPPDWGRVQANGLSGIPSDRYALNIRATTAPSTTAAVADSLSIYRMYFIREAVADNTAYARDFGSMEAVMIPGDALVAFFGTANDLNGVTALVRPRV